MLLNLPRFGFGDPTSYSIMAGAVDRLRKTGALRHGAECFNFYFPQELDDEYLIIWEGFERGSWKYVDEPSLRAFLSKRVNEGYSFPLNPKWVLADPGWYDLWEKMNASSAATAALNSWFPPESGLRERIMKVHEAYPDGFLRTHGPYQEMHPVHSGEEICGDMAHMQLKRHMALMRAKKKLKVNSTTRPPSLAPSLLVLVLKSCLI